MQDRVQKIRESSPKRRQRRLTWSLPWTNPEAERVLTAIARLTAVTVAARRLVPSAEEILRRLPPNLPPLAEPSLRQLVGTVIEASVWREMATDPRWRLEALAEHFTVRDIVVTGAAPAVLLHHPEQGWSYLHWLAEGHGTGMPWRHLRVLGLSVARTRKLELWKHRLVGSVYLQDGSVIQTRLFPEHATSAEWLIRTAALNEEPVSI